MDHTAVHLDHTRVDTGHAVVLVGGEHHGGPPITGLVDQRIDQVPAGFVQPRMGLVEEPELGPAGHHRRDRRPPPLAGRQPRRGQVAQATGEAQATERGITVRLVGTRGPTPEAHVLGHGQVVVESGVVTDEADPAPNVALLGAQVMAENPGLALRHRHQTGAQPQDGGLAGPVRALKSHDLTGLDPQIDTRERWEPSEQADGTLEVDGGDDGIRIAPVRRRGQRGGADAG